ncbi:MAG TPA: PAS domain S-box protein [Verrucomicrobiae bacterium]|nr:PAS domain S-box protein [Verrucomicrobiae bacterium]
MTENSLDIGSGSGGHLIRPGSSKHFVQFYEHDEKLVKSLGGFLGSGLGAGDGAIVIATRAHRDALEEQLTAQGIDLDRVKLRGQYTSLDAAETLSKFMRNGLPDEELFNQIIGGQLARVMKTGRPLRAFGEMVALLWMDGNAKAAIQLEKLWNNLAKIRSFTLFCAYPKNSFDQAKDAEAFTRICNEHSRVISPDGGDALPRPRNWLGLIAGLEEKTTSLETQIVQHHQDCGISQKLAAIVEFSDDAIISKDLNGVILSWNKGAERIFGYLPHEVIGKPITIMIPPDRLDEETVILARLRKGDHIDHYETVRRRKDGASVEISLCISPIKDGTGKIVGASKIARDITGRKEIERALRDAREQLARVNDDLERRIEERTSSLREAISHLQEFSYSVSHDLRAPVRAMQGYARVLREDYGDRLDDNGKEYLDRIIRGGARMDRLVQDILTYTSLSRREIQLQPVSLDQLIHDTVQQFPQMQPPRAEIVIQGKLPSVMAHEASLSQAISNLLNNAVKFVAPGALPRVRIRAERRDGQVRLWVEDNGIGIQPKHQHRLFGMFERVHHHAIYEGTGIGLAIVRRAAERMGGSAGVESDGFTGSSFWIQLAAAATA